ncbi:MAG: response regulator transcription factor [Pseudomonadota bacterium]
MTVGNRPVRVLLVEDHPLMREELQQAFAADRRVRVDGAAGSVRGARRLLGPEYDLALLDLQLPDGSGLELIEALRAAVPDIKIVVLTVHQDASHALQAVQHGVDGYVMKDDPQIVERIMQVMEGLHPVDARVTGYLMARVSRPQRTPEHGLTPRELQALCALYEGMSYKQIAEHLSVSPRTVPSYIKSLYRKLEVSSRGQAVFKAAQMGLIG